MGIILHDVVSFNFSSMQVIHEDITLGSGDIRKFIGICVNKCCLINNVSSAVDKNHQRVSIYAITLYFPFWC